MVVGAGGEDEVAGGVGWAVVGHCVWWEWWEWWWEWWVGVCVGRE